MTRSSTPHPRPARSGSGAVITSGSPSDCRSWPPSTASKPPASRLVVSVGCGHRFHPARRPADAMPLLPHLPASCSTTRTCTRALTASCDFRALAADAEAVGYHAAFATIPLDGWYASRRAVELFNANKETLSLLIHGNDHVRRELGRPLGPAARIALLGQGIRRIERFERRYGIRSPASWHLRMAPARRRWPPISWDPATARCV